MSAAAISFRTPVLAWSSAPSDDSRYRRIQATAFTIALVVGLIAKLMPTPEPAPDVVHTIPVEVAQMILEHNEPPPPPKPVETPTKDKAVEADVKATKPTPEAKTREVPQQPSQVDATAAARKKASGVGLFADNGSDTLAELRSAPAAVQMNQNIKPGSGVGAGSGAGVGAGTDPGLPTRNMITSGATGGSGGINTAGYSRDTGGGGLAGRATTVVEGVAGGGGGKGIGAGASKGGTVQAGKSGKSGRAVEDIRLVFERNKGKIYGIYNRALREDPSLQGKVVVELKIAPSGSVESVRLVSSELHAPETEAKLLAMIRQLDFGAKDVDTMVITYPLDFLPS